MTNETMRASDVDIVLQCGAAANAPDDEIDTTGPDARLGLAVHDSLEDWLRRENLYAPQPQPHANVHGVDQKAVAELIQSAPDAIAQIRRHMPEIEPEIKVTGGGIRGRIDGLSVTRVRGELSSIGLLDWKTGRNPAENSKPGQRLAYASAVEDTYGMPSDGYIYSAEIWLATGDIIETRFDLDTINGFRARLAGQIKRGRFSPGPACKYCRRRFDCAGRDKYLRSAAQALVELGPNQVTAEQIASLWDQSRLLKKAIEHYEAAVDGLVEENGGLNLPDGRRIIHATKTRETIDARAAWPIMSAVLNNEDINRVLSVSKTKLLEAVAAKAKRGDKAAAKAQIAARLDEAGAISRNTTRYRRIINP